MAIHANAPTDTFISTVNVKNLNVSEEQREQHFHVISMGVCAVCNVYLTDILVSTEHVGRMIARQAQHSLKKMYGKLTAAVLTEKSNVQITVQTGFAALMS